jgi:fructose 5-dehydrogenase small subunit
VNNLPSLPTVAQLRPVGTGAAVLTRRNFLVYSGVGLVSLSLLPVTSAFANRTDITPNDAQGFNALCQLLTNKSLDMPLTTRALSALTAVDKAFTEKTMMLSSFIKKGNHTSIEALKAAPDFQGEIRQTALTIISSLYLGYAGTPRPDHAEDNTQFVTYTGALMYRLTYKYTPIPSYSRWSTGYWTSVPK